jgi:hypothetical protein
MKKAADEIAKKKATSDVGAGLGGGSLEQMKLVGGSRVGAVPGWGCGAAWDAADCAAALRCRSVLPIAGTAPVAADAKLLVTPRHCCCRWCRPRSRRPLHMSCSAAQSSPASRVMQSQVGCPPQNTFQLLASLVVAGTTGSAELLLADVLL